MTPAFDTVFSEDDIPAYPLAIIALPGAEEFAEKVDKYLVDWYGRECAKKTPASFIVPTNFPRFTSGDGKAMILDSVRGKDLYVIIDTGNHGVQYKMFGQMQCMSPDDHFQNLKRLISAVGGKASRITVVMPLLYGGRQHRRNARESLDCAIMLRELEVMGVKDIITFDAHDPRVQNAVPLMGFDNFFPCYQILKAVVRKYPDIVFDKEHTMIISPDEGAVIFITLRFWGWILVCFTNVATSLSSSTAETPSSRTNTSAIPLRAKTFSSPTTLSQPATACCTLPKT